MALVTLRKVRTPAHRGNHFECEHFALERGQKWLVFGGNGSGKTRLAELVRGQQAVARGERIFAPGFNPSEDIALVSFEQQHKLHAQEDRFDDSELREDANDPGTCVRDFIRLDDREQEDWVARLGLVHLLESGLRSLSTGEMRKVLLAQALLASTPVLILDDPLAGLDKQAQAEFAVLLDDVMRELETVMILLSRSDLQLSNASHLMHLNEGRICSSGVFSKSALESLQSAPPLDGGEASKASLARWPDAPEPPSVLGNDLIRMRNVSVSFGDKKVFTGLNWTLPIGGHAHIMGPNGCGKSTLLSMLNGENVKAYGQDVQLFGRGKGSGETIWDVRKHIGTVSTVVQRQYARGVSVMEVVMSGFYDSVGLYDDAGSQQLSVAQQWLDIVGVGGLLKQRYRDLSYGQQRLVLLARAMVKQPSLLILDEPCIGLDDANRALILGLIDRLVENRRTHILFVSHVADERPHCISQTLEFVPAENGEGYQITVNQL